MYLISLLQLLLDFGMFIISLLGLVVVIVKLGQKK